MSSTLGEQQNLAHESKFANRVDLRMRIISQKGVISVPPLPREERLVNGNRSDGNKALSSWVRVVDDLTNTACIFIHLFKLFLPWVYPMCRGLPRWTALQHRPAIHPRWTGWNEIDDKEAQITIKMNQKKYHHGQEKYIWLDFDTQAIQSQKQKIHTNAIQHITTHVFRRKRL